MNLINAGIWDEPQSWVKQPVSVNLGSDVTSIGASVFSYSSLQSVTIPSSMLSIGDNAFEGCEELTSIVMPSNDVYVGDLAFSGCVGLANANGFVIIQGGLYGYYGMSNSITIPSNVTEIREEVFAGNADLTSVTIPYGVTYIGRSAFIACTGLTSMTIPSNVTSIENNAFAECDGLINIVISDSVTSIGEQAFANCTSLAHVTINDYNGDADNV